MNDSGHKICAIVAVGDNFEIGFNGDLIWHIKEDLIRFKSLTMGHPVIMGRKTRESLPKALPGRTNIVISRNPDYSAPDSVTAHSLDEAIEIARKSEGSEVIFIIGGGQIYEEAFHVLDNLEITHICEIPDNVDTYFPEVSGDEWIRTEKSDVFETSNGLKYVFESYIRVK